MNEPAADSDTRSTPSKGSADDLGRWVRMGSALLMGLSAIYLAFAPLLLLFWPFFLGADSTWLPAVALSRGLLAGLIGAGLALSLGLLHALAAWMLWRRWPLGWWASVLVALISVPVACGIPSVALLSLLSRPEVRALRSEAGSAPSPGAMEPG